MVYFTTMFPLHVNGPAALAIFFGSYCAVALARDEGLHLGWGAWFAPLTIFLNMLMLRAFDELKDQDVDAEVFPDRPLVTGAVSCTDVRLLGLLSIIVLLALNLGRGVVTDAYLLFFVLAVLSWQWWIFPDTVSTRFTLIFLTHQPLVPLQFGYVYAVYIYFSGGNFDLAQALGLSLSFWIPFVAWEIGRKIRAPEQEDAYLTYTRLWGTRRAPAIVIGLFLCGALAMAAMGLRYGLSLPFILFHAVLTLTCSTVVVRFILRPVAATCRVRSAVETYLILYYVAPIAEWALGRYA